MTPLLTCPRCAALCDVDCRYCAECGSRLLSDAAYPPVDDPIFALPYPDQLESAADALDDSGDRAGSAAGPSDPEAGLGGDR